MFILFFSYVLHFNTLKDEVSYHAKKIKAFSSECTLVLFFLQVLIEAQEEAVAKHNVEYKSNLHIGMLKVYMNNLYDGVKVPHQQVCLGGGGGRGFVGCSNILLIFLQGSSRLRMTITIPPLSLSFSVAFG